MAVDTGLREPARVSGGEGATGHLEELRVDPIALMERVRSECGDVGIFRLADRDVVHDIQSRENNKHHRHHQGAEGTRKS